MVSAGTCNRLADLADISAMDELERKQHSNRPCKSQLVTYRKLFIPIGPDGVPGVPITLGDSRTASLDGAPNRGAVRLAAGGTDDHGLYLSISSSRNTGTGYCSDWTFNGYFNWTMNPEWIVNSGYDFLGVTWAGNQSIAGYGAYGISANSTAYNFYADDILGNEGVLWRFKEYPGVYSNYMRYGYSSNSVRQTSCQGLAGDVRIRYIHTLASLSFSGSVGAGNPGSITVTPGTDQWGFAQVANFSY